MLHEGATSHVDPLFVLLLVHISAISQSLKQDHAFVLECGGDQCSQNN